MIILIIIRPLVFFPKHILVTFQKLQHMIKIIINYYYYYYSPGVFMICEVFAMHFISAILFIFSMLLYYNDGGEKLLVDILFYFLVLLMRL